MIDSSYLGSINRLKSVVRRRKLRFRRLRRYQATVGRHCPGRQKRNGDERRWASRHGSQSFRHEDPMRVKA